MSDPQLKMEVPAQVREFAEKSVDQAEKAISSFMESASKSVALNSGTNDRRRKAGTFNNRGKFKSVVRTCKEVDASEGYCRGNAASVRIRPKPIWSCH
jgi:hypothetical protein